MGHEQGKRNTLVVGLDVGTCRCGGRRDDDGGVDHGTAYLRRRTARKGTVVNIDATVEDIRRAVEEAELMAGRIRSVIAGSSVRI